MGLPPLTSLSDQNFSEYVLGPAPQDGLDSGDGVVTVQNTNQAAVANNDFYGVTLRQSVSDPGATFVNPGGVLANDTDVDLDPLTAVLVGSGPSHGTLDFFSADGSFSYTPALGYVGPDSFTYRANDGFVNSNLATVNLTVGSRLSIPTNLPAVPGGTVVVPVNIDNPNPFGSGGFNTATLAMNYDPALFTVSAGDFQTGPVTDRLVAGAHVQHGDRPDWHRPVQCHPQHQLPGQHWRSLPCTCVRKRRAARRS